MDLINAKVDANGVAGVDDKGVAGPPKQNVPHPEIFITPSDWSVLLDPAAVSVERVACLANRFSKAGLQKFTETAIRNVICLAYLDMGPPENHINNALAAGRTIMIKLNGRAKCCTAAGTLPSFETSI